jgi:hypothetical protein
VGPRTSLNAVCPFNKYCPSARCAYAANATYLQSEPFISITFILINLKLLIIFVHTLDVLWHVVLSYHVRLCVCLIFCINAFFPPVLACSLS